MVFEKYDILTERPSSNAWLEVLGCAADIGRLESSQG